MKKFKTAMMLVAVTMTVVLFAAFACACSTTAFSNLGSYFDHVGEVLAGSDSGGPSSSGGNTERTPLATPSGFTIAGGEYSFTGVDNATAYVLSMYDADSAGEEAVATATIDVASSGNSYSGRLSDLMSYAYGSYSVELVAYASRVSEYTDSEPATASMTVTGALSAPQIEYSWNGSTMTFQLGNASVYATEVIPDAVQITITDTTDPAGSATASLTSVDTSSARNNNVEVELSVGHAYTVSAVAESGSAYVTAAESEVFTLTLDNLPDGELQSDDFEEQGGWGPGGPGGPGGNVSISVSTVESFAEGADTVTVNITAMNSPYVLTGTLSDTPTAGSDYTYSLSGRGGMGEAITGMLEILSDHTVTCTVDGFGPFSSENASGTWELVDGNIVVTLA